MFEHCGRVADRTDRAITRGEGFDQRLAVTVFGQIPKWPMAAGVKDRIKAIGRDGRQNFGMRQRLLGRVVGLEALGRRSLHAIRGSYA